MPRASISHIPGHTLQFTSRCSAACPILDNPSRSSSTHTHTTLQLLPPLSPTPQHRFNSSRTAGQLFHVHQVRLSRRSSSLSSCECISKLRSQFWWLTNTTYRGRFVSNKIKGGQGSPLQAATRKARK